MEKINLNYKILCDEAITILNNIRNLNLPKHIAQDIKEFFEKIEIIHTDSTIMEINRNFNSVNNSPGDLFHLTDQDGKILYVKPINDIMPNSANHEYTGTYLYDFILQNMSLEVCDTEITNLNHVIHQLNSYELSSHQNASIAFTLQNKLGIRIVLQLIINKKKTENGLGYEISLKDFPENKTNEKSLESSEEKLKLLNEIIFEMLKLKNKESIYDYITSSLQLKLPNTIILYNSVNKDQNETKLESIAGITESIFSKVITLIGFNPVGRKFSLQPNHNNYIRTGKLVEYEQGLAEFSASAIPNIIAHTIEKFVGLHKIYTIGIINDDSLLASIHLFTFNKTIIQNKDFIESFVQQAGIILQKKIAQLELKDSEERWKFALENAKERVWDWNIKTNHIFISNQWKAMLGYTEDEIENNLEGWQKLIHPEDLSQFINDIHLHLVGKSSHYSNIHRELSKDGTYKWILDQGKSIDFDDKGYPVRMIGTHADITEQVEIRKELLLAKEKIEQTQLNYESFFNTIDEFLFVLDEQGNIIHMNNTVITKLEYCKEELLGKSVLIVHPPERRQEAERIVSEMLNGETEFCPVPLISKSGEQIAVETIVTRGIWNGKPAMFGVSKNISRLKLSEEKFSKAFHSNSAIMALSLFESGIFIEINEAFLTTLGYSKDEVIGKNSQELNLFVNYENRKSLSNKINHIGKAKDTVVEIRTKSGAIKYGLFSAEKLFIGKDLCLLTTMIDITFQKEAEAIINHQNNQLRKLNDDKDRFIAILAHDLKNPFNLILGYLELLTMNLRKYDIDKIEKQISKISSSALRTYDLLADLLSWARSQSEKIPFKPRKINLQSIYNDLFQSIKQNTQDKNISINYFAPLDQFIFADPNMIKAILRNLISNAIKFTNRGGQIDVTLQKGENFAILSICDNGVGIE